MWINIGSHLEFSEKFFSLNSRSGEAWPVLSLPKGGNHKNRCRFATRLYSVIPAKAGIRFLKIAVGTTAPTKRLYILFMTAMVCICSCNANIRAIPGARWRKCRFCRNKNLPCQKMFFLDSRLRASDRKASRKPSIFVIPAKAGIQFQIIAASGRSYKTTLHPVHDRYGLHSLLQCKHSRHPWRSMAEMQPRKRESSSK